MGLSWRVCAGAWTVLLVQIHTGGIGLQARQTADALGDPLPPGAVARLGSTRFWHEGTRAIAFSAGDKELATMGVRRTAADSFVSTIRWWDAATGRLLRETAFPNLRLTAWAASPDGKRLILGVDDSKGRRIVFWDVAEGREIDGPAMKHIWPITELAILPDGKTLVSRDPTEDRFHYWDLATRKEIKSCKPNSPPKKQYTIRSSALSADGKRSAWYMKTQQGEIIQVVDEDGKTLFQQNAHSKGFTIHLAISPDGRRLVWASERDSLRLVDIATQETLAILSIDSGYSESMAFSPNGKIVACKVGVGGFGSYLKLWDVENQRDLTSLFISADSPQWDPPLAFSSDSKSVAVSGRGVARVYDIATGKERVRLPGPRVPVRSIYRSAEGKNLLSSDGIFASRWQRDAANGFRPAPEIRSHPVLERNFLGEPGRAQKGDDVFEKNYLSGPLYSPDLTRKVNEGGIVLDISQATPRKLARLELQDAPYTYWDGQVSPDNRRILMVRVERNNSDPCKYEVFDAGSGKRIASWPLAGLLNSVFSPDGRLFAWQDSEKGRLLLGDLRSGRELKPASINLMHKPARQAYRSGSNMPNAARFFWRFDCLAFSPDNRRLAAAWNSTLAASLGLFEYAVKQDKEPTTLYVWDTATGAETARIIFEPMNQAAPAFMRRAATNMPHLTSLAFTSDGRCLAACFLHDADVHLLEVASGRQRAVLRGHQSMVRALALSADGRYLISGSDDTTLLVWDLDSLPPTGTQSPAEQELRRLWQDLASADAAVAYRAMRRLQRSPRQALSLLGSHLAAAPVVEPERISRWIGELDSMDFETRTRATAQLEQLAEVAEPALRKALRDHPSLELRRRLEQLLDGLPPKPLPPARLRPLRAVEVLEAIGNRAAQEHLEKLARGAPAARLTCEAKESLRRLHAAHPSR